MEKSLEDNLYQAVLREDHKEISYSLRKGANPNKTTSFGKTCLGEAANMGNVDIGKLLIDASLTAKPPSPIRHPVVPKIQNSKGKTQKRKYKQVCQDSETLVKCKNVKDRKDANPDTVVKYKNVNDDKETDFNKRQNEAQAESSSLDSNQGYFVFIHKEGSSSDDSYGPSISPVSPPPAIPSPQSDLEWDEEIDNGVTVADTSEDETWSSMYRWYAAILESTGAAIASASSATNGIDQQDTYMRTALHYAVEQGHVGVILLLLQAGCKLDLAAGDGLTPLHVAVIKNHKEIAQILLIAGSHVNYKTHEKATSLHFAASRGFFDMVNILVTNGAYLEARDTSERTPLYLAVVRGHVDVVKYLISVGANVNTEQIHGYTPLCEAVWKKSSSMVEVLIGAGARITHSHKLLHSAVFHGLEAIVKILISTKGTRINLHDDNGDTPLLTAARLAQPHIARILLESGACVNACNSITGANALHIAIESIDCPDKLKELLNCLIEYNINMNSTALTGDTALNRALLLNKDGAAALLIRHGADVNACDLQCCGLANLTIASRRRYPILASMLLKAGHYIPPPESDVAVPKPGTTAYWLHCIYKEPFSLSDLCRIKIRNMHDEYKYLFTMFSYIHRLPLPKSLQRFLMMEDEGPSLGTV